MEKRHPKISVFNVILKSLSLSPNAETKKVDVPELAGVSNLNGQLNVTSDNRQFFVAEFQEKGHPFSPTTKLTVMQDKPGNWKAGSPTDLIPFIGKPVPGITVQTCPTEANHLKDKNGNLRYKKDGVTPILAYTFTAVVNERGQDLESMMKAQGITIQGETPAFNTVAENAETPVMLGTEA